MIDATNVEPEARARLILAAREYGVPPVAIVLDVPVAICWQRTTTRTDRDISRRTLAGQHRDLRRSFGELHREGFQQLHVLTGPDEVDAVTVAVRAH